MGHVDEKGKQNPKQPPPYPWKAHLCCGGCRHAGGAAVSGKVCAEQACAVSVQRPRVRGAPRGPGLQQQKYTGTFPSIQWPLGSVLYTQWVSDLGGVLTWPKLWRRVYRPCFCQQQDFHEF